MAAEQAFQSITADNWKNSCQHVMKIEREYYERGETMYEQIERLVINLRDDSSSDSSETEYDSEVSGTSNQDLSFSGVEYLDESELNSD